MDLYSLTLLILLVCFALQYFSNRKKYNAPSCTDTGSSYNAFAIDIIAIFSGFSYCAFYDFLLKYDFGYFILLLFVIWISTSIMRIQNQYNDGVATSLEDISGTMFFVSLIISPIINILTYTILFCVRSLEIGSETETSIINELKCNRTKDIIYFFVSFLVAIIDYFYKEFVIVDFETNFFVCAITLLITNYFIPYIIDRILSVNNYKKQFEKAL